MSRAQVETRSVGIYPGNPNENFSPTLKADSSTYRNIALHRPVYQSSSYDFNLIGQLLTDGIKDTLLPGWTIASTSNEGALRRNEREYVLDRHIMTRKNIIGSEGWLQIELAGKNIMPEVDSISIQGSLMVNDLPVKRWNIRLLGSNDTTRWDTIGMLTGFRLPGDSITGPWRRFLPPNLRSLMLNFSLLEKVKYSIYRLELNSPNINSWSITEFSFCYNGSRCNIGGPYQFTSAWMNEGSKAEWVYVDLGAVCWFDRLTLSWARRAIHYVIQTSNNAIVWNDLISIPTKTSLIDTIALQKPIDARFVRLYFDQIVPNPIPILSELEIFGKGGLIAVPHSQAPMKHDTTLLSGGAWRLQRTSLVQANGEELSKNGFNDNDWLIATVPGTVLVSYLNAGALPNPNYGDNQLMISDSYFYSDFWYRNEFIAPSIYSGKRVFLNFSGINWKADVYLNGKKLGIIEGAFTRGVFDVTEVIIPGRTNTLAVLIKKNDNPGYIKEQTKLSHDVNGGELGADNPTFHASVGWDWIPSIRGRNIGIWNDVFLTTSGPVTIKDPFILSDLPLPDTSSADISIVLTLCNHKRIPVKGILRGSLGKVKFEQSVVLDSLESKTIRLSPVTHKFLHLKKPKLWWPNGYGEQNLYNVSLAFVTSDGGVSDIKSFKTGIREMSYSEQDTVLRIWINGKRFIGKGGNWGFSESMLRYRAREYDIAVRYHKDMNFTMIRNWVGQVPHEEFFEACDRHGIMVWQDFWLANPVDGPNPNSHKLFIENTIDFVKRVRNHPSIGLYCGRNEGNPPDELDSLIRDVLPKLHPDIHYISNSASDVVSGGGPYRAMPVKFYFEKRATDRFHSEMGMPNMVSYESLRQMIPDSALWPIDRLWGVHDFNLESAQYGKSFIQQLEERFGAVDSLKEWLTLAQWVNYDGYRAMFEAQSKNRLGLLLWMSHPAWPSMVWQTYDYYFEPTAAYFGCKKACEPLHIQWNQFTDSIEVVNYSSQFGSELTATVELLRLDGTVSLQTRATVNCPIDCTIRFCKITFADTTQPISFVRLKLTKGKKLLSENFYIHSTKVEGLKTIRTLPKVKLEMKTNYKKTGDRLHLTTSITNPSGHPALMIKLKVVGKPSQERILPVIFSDNYFSLMPRQKRVIDIELAELDTHDETPEIQLEGINIE
jgi:hypothetical protein